MTRVALCAALLALAACSPSPATEQQAQAQPPAAPTEIAPPPAAPTPKPVAAVPLSPANDDGGASAALGETFTCNFPKAGRVVIDTREPGSTIVYRGKRYAASGGSYFYTAVDHPDIMVMFGPKMERWEFGADGDRDDHCLRTKNPR